MNRHFRYLASVLSITTWCLAEAGLGEGMTAFKEERYQDALRELSPLAEQGVPLAQMAVGLMYTEGRGVAKNVEEGMKWQLRAAEKGLAAAQVNVGAHYFLGFEVKKDWSQAIKWYSRAANQGWPQAQFNLASMYSNGEGVEKDLVVAHKWCLLSAHGTPAGESRERALRRCDRLKPQLSPEDIANAKALASVFVPKPEMTQDAAGQIYQACIPREEERARTSRAEFPVMEAYSVCSNFAEPCRYSADGSECEEGLKKYGP